MTPTASHSRPCSPPLKASRLFELGLCEAGLPPPRPRTAGRLSPARDDAAGGWLATVAYNCAPGSPVAARGAADGRFRQLEPKIQPSERPVQRTGGPTVPMDGRTDRSWATCKVKDGPLLGSEGVSGFSGGSHVRALAVEWSGRAATLGGLGFGG